MSDDNQAAVAMAAVNDAIAPIIEGAAGYRARALAAGFSETAAETMAVAYHHEVIRMAFRQNQPGGDR